jgi:hypothetical protein
MARNYRQGKYEVVNRDKYKGDPDKVKFRSSYEAHCYAWADRTESVLSWAVETIVVPYIDPVTNKKRRYIVDMWMEYKDRNGDVKIELIEIKPKNQCVAPKRGGKRKDVFENEIATYMTNQAKWQYADQYARERGWGFRVITEDSIFK